MTIISRYIVTIYLRLLLLCSGAFVAIYLVIDFLEKFGRFAQFHPDPRHLAQFFAAKIPDIVNQIIPLAVLMATLLTLGMLSKTSEITAMRSCGISLARISAPILTLAFLVSLLVLVNGEIIVPRANAHMEYVETVLIKKKSPDTFFRQSNIWHREEITILQAKLFDPKSRTLQGITLWVMAPDMQPIRRIDAVKATISNGVWLFKDVMARELSGGSVVSTQKIAELALPLRLKLADLKVLEKFADNMGFIQLWRYSKKLQRGGYDATRYLAQMHSRLSLPFSTLVMAFLGIPFALRSGRSSGIAVGIGMSVAIGFSFYAVNSALLSFGQAGALPPLIAAWAANFIFAAVGVWLTLTVNR
jgi:lipopolysaccharide export system permease protein